MRVMVHPGYDWLCGDFKFTVKVAGFVFRFDSLGEVRAMLTRFQGSHSGSDGKGTEFGKLPMWLKDKKHRPLVIKAFKAVLAAPPKHKFSRPDFSLLEGRRGWSTAMPVAMPSPVATTVTWFCTTYPATRATARLPTRCSSCSTSRILHVENPSRDRVGRQDRILRSVQGGEKAVAPRSSTATKLAGETMIPRAPAPIIITEPDEPTPDYEVETIAYVRANLPELSEHTDDEIRCLWRWMSDVMFSAGWTTGMQHQVFRDGIEIHKDCINDAWGYG